MGIYVGDPKTRILEAPNLRRGFGFDLVNIEVPAERSSSDVPESGRKAGVTRQQPGNSIRRQQRLTVHQDDVAADAQSWLRLRPLNRIGKGAAVRHQGRRCNDAVSIGFGDATVYPRSKAKIVGVDNEAAQEGRIAG
jgi:hypothetical protein